MIQNRRPCVSQRIVHGFCGRIAPELAEVYAPRPKALTNPLVHGSTRLLLDAFSCSGALSTMEVLLSYGLGTLIHLAPASSIHP